MSRFKDLENHEIGNTLEFISFFRSQMMDFGKIHVFVKFHRLNSLIPSIAYNIYFYLIYF